MKAISRIIIFMQFTLTVFGSFYDNTRDCSQINTMNSLCYNGPRFNEYNQISSCNKPGTIAIAIDDGLNQYTDQFLDILKSNKMKATFFVTGSKIDLYQTSLQKIITEGHQIGSFTYNLTEDGVTDITADKFNNDIAMFERVFTNINIPIPMYFRPPNGFLTEDARISLQNQQYLSVDNGFFSGSQIISYTIDDIITQISQIMNRADLNRLSIILNLNANKFDSTSFNQLITYLSTFKSIKYRTISDCLNNQNQFKQSIHNRKLKT